MLLHDVIADEEFTGIGSEVTAESEPRNGCGESRAEDAGFGAGRSARRPAWRVRSASCQPTGDGSGDLDGGDEVRGCAGWSDDGLRAG